MAVPSYPIILKTLPFHNPFSITNEAFSMADLDESQGFEVVDFLISNDVKVKYGKRLITLKRFNLLVMIIKSTFTNT